MVGTFGGIERRDFGTFEWRQCVTTKFVASRYGGVEKVRRLLGKFSESGKPKSNQRPSGSRNHL